MIFFNLIIKDVRFFLCKGKNMSDQTKSEDEKITRVKDASSVANAIAAIHTKDLRVRSSKQFQDRLEIRRQRALNREKSREEQIKNMPSEIEAKEAVLVSAKNRRAKGFWSFDVPLDDMFIRDAVLEAFPRIDDAYDFLTNRVPAFVEQKKMRQIQIQLDSRFADLEKIKDKQKEAVLRLYKEYGLSFKKLSEDPRLMRITPPPAYRFTIKSGRSAQLLRLCDEIDKLVMMEDYLVMFGYMQESIKIKDSRALQAAIRNYVLIIYSTQQKINKILRSNRNSDDKKASVKETETAVEENISATGTQVPEIEVNASSEPSDSVKE